MNIALSAVLISILLIPSVVFYIGFYLGEHPKPAPKFSIFEGILASAVFSLFIHAFAISLLKADIRFDVLIMLLGGDLKDVQKICTNQQVRSMISDFALYNIVLLTAMFILARLVRLLVLQANWHIRFEYLNLFNKWFYTFQGVDTDIDSFDLIFVDAVVNTQDGTIIYSGYLVDFDLENGELNRIYLENTLRREFKRIPKSNTTLINEPGVAVNVPGDLFVLKYESVLNLNLSFLLIEEKDS